MPLEVSENIIQAVRLGDRNAFAQLVDRSSNFVYAVALKMLGNKQDAEDEEHEIGRQPLGRPAKMQFFCHGHEISEVSQFHGY